MISSFYLNSELFLLLIFLGLKEWKIADFDKHYSSRKSEVIKTVKKNNAKSHEYSSLHSIFTYMISFNLHSPMK